MKIKITKILLVLTGLLLQAQIALAHPAWGIVVDRQRQIYFSDLETIWKIDAQGKLSVFRTGVSGRHVHDLSIDAQDNIYGLDNTYESQGQKFFRSLWKMSPKGEFTEVVALTENLPQGMNIWRDSSGSTYSVEPYNNEKLESKIIKRIVEGKTTLFAGGNYGLRDGVAEKAQFGSILDMAFAIDGLIYLTDSDTVRRIDKNGKVSTVFRPQTKQNPKKIDSSSRKLYGLAVDKQNNVFVADFANRQLLKIKSNGKISIVLDSEKDWSPLGAATFDADVYVLEGRPYSSSKHNGSRVLKISADGKSMVVANTENGKELSDLPSQAANTVSKTDNPVSYSNTDLFKNPLTSYFVIGFVSVIFAAILIFVKRKKLVSPRKNDSLY